MRRNLISNATQLIRASRGRGLIISSEAKVAAACRGPWDAINFAAVWGLSQERGHDAMSKECRSLVVGARLKRTSYRGVIDVVYGGEKDSASTAQPDPKPAKTPNGQKRKADVMEKSATDNGNEKPLSKRQAKRQAHEARVRAAAEAETTT